MKLRWTNYPYTIQCLFARLLGRKKIKIKLIEKVVGKLKFADQITGYTDKILGEPLQNRKSLLTIYRCEASFTAHPVWALSSKGSCKWLLECQSTDMYSQTIHNAVLGAREAYQQLKTHGRKEVWQFPEFLVRNHKANQGSHKYWLIKQNNNHLNSWVYWAVAQGPHKHRGPCICPNTSALNF